MKPKDFAYLTAYRKFKHQIFSKCTLHFKFSGVIISTVVSGLTSAVSCFKCEMKCFLYVHHDHLSVVCDMLNTILGAKDTIHMK